ncbi:uncharacterized protein [Haliaeetus albicilla]|uniref:uncharacterized protein isoform X2 n=1 Tax=Haliaeetus albicilla TaxID=8969 RepID=UPI0037E87B31
MEWAAMERGSQTDLSLIKGGDAEGTAETEVFPVEAASAGPDVPPPRKFLWEELRWVVRRDLEKCFLDWVPGRDVKGHLYRKLREWEERPPAEEIIRRLRGLGTVVEEETPPREGNQAPLLGEGTEPPGTPAAPSTAPLPERVKPSSGSFQKWSEVPAQGNSDSSDEEKVDGVIRRPSKPAPQIRTEEGPNALQRVQGLLRRLEGAIQNAERMVLLMPPTQGAGDGQEGGTQKGTDWRLVAKECCLSGVQFQPVVLPIRAAARGGYEWTPFDVKTVWELASTVQAHGVNSAQALTLFECLLSTPVAPFDVMQLMRGVLPPSLLLLFKEEWRAQCIRVVADAQYPDHHLAGVTIEQLLGEGQFATPQAQAQGMHGRDFAAVATTALATFKRVAAMDRADPPWVKIHQGIAERFTAFLDRLQLAIQAANLPETAKEATVVECAKAQANPQTAALLSHLPAGSSLGKIIRHVLEREQQQEARPIAAALEQVLQAGTGACHRCGGRGHIARN